MENKVLVAIYYDSEKKCKQVSKVANLTEKQYNALLNEQYAFESKEEEKQEKINQRFNDHQLCLEHHERLHCVLAKSIYDNFVDRGLLENDDEFQQMWFDFYFNDKELDLEKAPQEYKKILVKVESL